MLVDCPSNSPTKFELVINLKNREGPRSRYTAVAAAAGGSGDRMNRVLVAIGT
jgi:hypothetical protein